MGKRKSRETERPEIVLGDPRCRHSYEVKRMSNGVSPYLECQRCGKTQG